MPDADAARAKAAFTHNAASDQYDDPRYILDSDVDSVEANVVYATARKPG
jgi:hypothetical protein